MKENLIKQKNFLRDYMPFFQKTLRELAVIPAPSHKEEARTEYCFSLMSSFGVTGHYVDHAQSVIFPYRCDDANEIDVICAHLDTVFPDLTPYPLREDEDYIHCPGICDDTANAVLVLSLAKYLAEKQPKTKRGLLLALVTGEEGLGNLKGTRNLLRNYGTRIKSFVSFDCGFGRIASDCVGSTRYEITVKETGGHSWGAFGARNAIANLSRLICRLYEVEVPAAEGTRTTYNVGGISGGISVNTIAPEATVLYEYRSNSYECMKKMKETFDRIIEEAKEYCTEIEVKVIGERPCSKIDPALQEALVEEMKEMIRAIDPECEPTCVDMSTDCNIPLSMGIPAVVPGTFVMHGAHTRGEWLLKSSCENAMKVAFSVLNQRLS